jgi:hypothetical protein
MSRKNDCSHRRVHERGTSSSVAHLAQGQEADGRQLRTARTAREPSALPSAGSPSASATRSSRSAQSAGISSVSASVARR